MPLPQEFSRLRRPRQPDSSSRLLPALAWDVSDMALPNNPTTYCQYCQLRIQASP